MYGLGGGEQPLTLKNGGILYVGFTSFRGTTDLGHMASTLKETERV